jgi:curved DNA-binding protein
MAAAQGENFYTVLGVPNKASREEIQAAFKKRARELHPDVNKAPDAEEKFKTLVSAYEVLKDDDKRARYDAFGINGSHAKRRPAPQRDGHRPRSKTPPPGSFEDLLNFEEFSSPFDTILRRTQKKQKREREVKLNIQLEQAYTGTTLNVTLEAPSTKEQQRFKIKIPPGAKEGDRLKLKDPNVIVVLHIEPHPRFELEGRDITAILEVAPWEAALGAEVELKTPGGVVKVRVPPATSSGQKLRLRGQGLPLKPGKDGEPGDLYVKLKIVMPRTVSDKEKELWKQLAESSTFDPRATTTGS